MTRRLFGALALTATLTVFVLEWLWAGSRPVMFVSSGLLAVAGLSCWRARELARRRRLRRAAAQAAVRDEARHPLIPGLLAARCLPTPAAHDVVFWEGRPAEGAAQ